ARGDENGVIHLSSDVSTGGGPTNLRFVVREFSSPNGRLLPLQVLADPSTSKATAESSLATSSRSLRFVLPITHLADPGIYRLKLAVFAAGGEKVSEQSIDVTFE